MEWCDYETIGEDENIRLSEEQVGITDQDKYHNEKCSISPLFTDR
jgi:hypothetical protein